MMAGFFCSEDHLAIQDRHARQIADPSGSS
jgi:hypothetical protein